MDEFFVKIKLLLEITNKKKSVLEKIYNITENQYCILLGSHLEADTNAIFNEISKEKQSLIDEIYNMDTVFQRTFDGCKHYLNNESYVDSHRERLQQLQSAIDEVMLFDEKIRKKEEDNTMIINEQRLTVRKIDVPKMDTRKLLEHYKLNDNIGTKYKIKE